MEKQQHSEFMGIGSSKYLLSPNGVFLKKMRFPFLKELPSSA
jgi:hypothetical protein